MKARQARSLGLETKSTGNKCLENKQPGTPGVEIFEQEKGRIRKGQVRRIIIIIRTARKVVERIIIIIIIHTAERAYSEDRNELLLLFD